MTKMKNVRITESLIDKRFVLIENTCYINNFTLRIFSNPEDSHLPDNIEIPLDNLKIELKTRHNKALQNSPKIISRNGRLSLERDVTLKEGNVELIWQDNYNNSVIIRMRFEMTEDLNNAYDFQLFFEEISELLDKYLNLNKTTKNQGKLDFFLNPHYYGVKNYLFQLNTPTEISYKLKKNYLILYGCKNRKLYNYIYSKRADLDEKISTNIIIDKKELKMYWDDEREEWFFQKEERNKIPIRGLLKIAPKKDKNKIHNDRKFNFSKDCIVKIKESPQCEGGKILRNVLSEEDDSEKKIEDSLIEIKELIIHANLEEEYKRLNREKKKILDEIRNYLIIILNGDSGTGKTELAAFLAILYSILGKRILISSEKNRAIDKLYERIISIIKRIQKINNPIDIVRFKAKSHKIYETELNEFEIENQISEISNNIQDHCGNNSNDVLKKEVLKTFTNKNILQYLISLTYGIIISTYGTISQQKALSNPFLNYDLNIIEASSSVNLSLASVGAYNSKQWLLLNDKEQLAPLIPDNLLLRQPLIFPNKTEIQEAKKYDSTDQSIKKAKVNWGNKEYQKGVASLFNDINENKYLCHYQLKEQFRIDRNLYEFICDVFEKEYHLPSVEIDHSLDLGKISNLFPSTNHLKFIVMNKDEILSQMGKEVSTLIDTISTLREKSDKVIRIGIACTDVESLKIIIEAYQLDKYGNKIPSMKTTYYQDDEIGGIQLIFSSIDNHQECEYDIFILGIINFNAKHFKRRIYTALTRAHSFVMVFGPKIKSYFKSSKYYLDQNKKIIQKLYEGGT